MRVACMRFGVKRVRESFMICWRSSKSILLSCPVLSSGPIALSSHNLPLWLSCAVFVCCWLCLLPESLFSHYLTTAAPRYCLLLSLDIVVSAFTRRLWTFKYLWYIFLKKKILLETSLTIVQPIGWLSFVWYLVLFQISHVSREDHTVLFL